MKKVRRLIGAMLISCMALSISAGAIKTVENLGTPDQIGWEDAHGTDVMVARSTRALDPLCSLYASSVSNLLVSSSEKMISRSDLTNGYLRMSGTLTNSKNSQKIKVGLCHYDTLTGTYVADLEKYLPSGEWGAVSWPKSEVPIFDRFVYIKNTSGTGTVSGDLFVYNADW